MPAGSEAAPQLPRTWRPFGVRIAVGVLGGMLFVLVALVWVGLDESVRRQFTGFQRGTLVFLALLLLATYNALWRSRVTATADRLTVVNGYRTRTYEWSQVIGVSLRRGAPWATADLSDGTTVSLFAIQGSDGARARRAIQEIRATVAARTPDPPDDPLAP
jgi:hypothetical protein